jgi:hypothetical protein
MKKLASDLLHNLPHLRLKLWFHKNLISVFEAKIVEIVESHKNPHALCKPVVVTTTK